MDTVGPLPETKARNEYILVAINHYSKWCEAKVVANHGARTAARFLEDNLICRYGVPGFILTDNGGEWGAEFEIMCKDYAIQHQRTAPQWPQCNGMAEHMIKTIKHGITVLATNPANVDCWDEHMAKVLFGYICGTDCSTISGEGEAHSKHTQERLAQRRAGTKEAMKHVCKQERQTPV